VDKEGPWAESPATYRQEQVRTILRWVRVGESGSVVGMSGAGKSNLLGFLSSRPDAAQPFLGDAGADTCFLLLDVNLLPALTRTAFYREMLESLHRHRPCLPDPLQDELFTLYQGHINLRDDLLLLTTARDMHRVYCYEGGKRLVWLIDRFDGACRRLEAQFFNSLRALRDEFKGQLCYVVATRHPLPQLRDPAEIDEFYEIVAANTCWVGPMVERDARWVARQMAARFGTTFAEEDVARILTLTGRLPAFLKAAFTWLAVGELGSEEGQDAWEDRLLGRDEIQRECGELWDGLTDVQRVALLGVMFGSLVTGIEPKSLAYLERQGLVVGAGEYRRVFSPLFEAYVRQSKSPGRPIRLHPETRAVWRGNAELPITLTAKEDQLLSYFLEHTGELCTKDTLARAVWPDEIPLEGVRDDRLAQLVRRLREKIEFDPSVPDYVLTVHGQGYRFVQPGA